MLSSQPLSTPDIPAARRHYGVEFVTCAEAILNKFQALCGQLVHNQVIAMSDQGLDVDVSKPAVWYKPQVFLSRPLTIAQTEAINERETSAVADYCISVQSELRKVPIRDSGEELVLLPAAFNTAGISASFSDIPFPDVSGNWAGKPQEFWVRHSFAKRLLALGQLVNCCQVELHIIEAFRPVGVQEGMFRRRIHRTQQEHPNWTTQQITDEACSKTASSPRLASHKGGAAVDVLLRSVNSGELLDFGHEYPDGGVLVFPRTPYVTANQWRNRQLLQVAAGLCGLTLYVGEDWHLSYGDNLAALDENGQVRSNYIAQFGPIKDFDRTSGIITDYYDIDELDQTFTPW